MAYIIAEPCIGTKDTDCVEVCPEDSVHPAKGRTYDEVRTSTERVKRLIEQLNPECEVIVEESEEPAYEMSPAESKTIIARLDAYRADGDAIMLHSRPQTSRSNTK
jgi:NAD-dependent dihydropyrimidine dehydrogenase PreA subunit